MADDDRTFEDQYADFMARGDFTRPCVSEQYQRQEAQRAKHKPTRCPHGLTYLTCGTCYLNGWNRK